MKLNRWQRKRIRGMTEREFNDLMDAICALRHKEGVIGYIRETCEWTINLEAEKKAKEFAMEIVQKRAAERQEDLLNDFKRIFKNILLLLLGGFICFLLLQV